MTNQLRELSRAVAHVLGWTNIYEVNGVVYGHRGDVEYVLPRYATDAALLPDLFAGIKSLLRDGEWLTIASPAKGRADFATWEMAVGGSRVGYFAEDGATISLAACRLVLALHEARGAKP